MLSEISIVFHNVSSCDYLFIINELAKEFEGQLECLGEKGEKYKTFSVPIEKKIIKIEKDDNESVVTKCYKI